jgi:hypothetical protein
MQRLVLSLQDTVVLKLVLKLYSLLNRLSTPHFAHHWLHLPCIAFPVTEIRWKSIEHTETNFTYEVKVDGLHDLKITTEDRLLQFSRGIPGSYPPQLERFEDGLLNLKCCVTSAFP